MDSTTPHQNTDSSTTLQIISNTNTTYPPHQTTSNTATTNDGTNTNINTTTPEATTKLVWSTC